MVQNVTIKRKYRNSFCYVVLRIWGRNLKPEEITKKLNIAPDESWHRGLVRDKYGEIIKHKDGTPIKRHYGQWNLEAHVHENSGLENRIKNIIKQIMHKRNILKQILKTTKADLKIVIQPDKRLAVAGWLFSGKILNEFTSLGIDI